MKLQQAILQFYYDATLHELRLMNENTLYPDISYHSLLYLDLIAYRENCTASYLAQALHVSKPAVTAKINELIAQGLVVKTQSRDDRRVNYITLSEPMQADYRSYDKRLQQAAMVVKSRYTAEEIDTFVQMLGVIGKEYIK